jgi:hypothetical protein
MADQPAGKVQAADDSQLLALLLEIEQVLTQPEQALPLPGAEDTWRKSSRPETALQRCLRCQHILLWAMGMIDDCRQPLSRRVYPAQLYPSISWFPAFREDTGGWRQHIRNDGQLLSYLC